MFLFQASKIEESMVLVLQVLKPETKIFSFLELVVLCVRSDLTYHITYSYMLFNKHSKTMG